jgi:hypothetical protein
MWEQEGALRRNFLGTSSAALVVAAATAFSEHLQIDKLTLSLTPKVESIIEPVSKS